MDKPVTQPHVLNCPECGRSLNIPPGKGKVTLACKGCLHLYSYDYEIGTMTGRGRIQAANTRQHGMVRLALQIGLIMALGTALCLILYFKPFTAKKPVIMEPMPEHTLEDIQKQLKSLKE